MTTDMQPAPEPHVDSPEPPRPDQIDTVSPGLNDESPYVERQPEPSTPDHDGAATNVATEESSG